MAICRTAEYPIYFEESGRGKPIVLIHGHALDLRVWDDVVPGLVGAGHRVIRYDVRGHGQSFAPGTGYSWAAYVEDLRALLAHVGVEDVALVGFSMGGGIALAFAQAHPRRVRTLALVSPALPGFPYSDEVTGPAGRLTARVRAEGPHPAFEEGFLALPLFDGLRSDADALDKVHAMVAGYSAKEYLVDGEPQPDSVIATLPAMAVPTLVVSGDADMADMRAISARLAAEIPGATLVTHAAGHMLPMETPTELTADLLAFIRQHADRS